MEDTVMDDAPPATAPEASPSPEADDANYVPPSVDRAATLAGDSHTYYSPIPPCLVPSGAPTSSSSPSDPPRQPGPACVLGVDEAGRGPVLGPMVYGVFYIPAELSTPLLKERHRFDDSKVLTPAVRTALMRELCADPSSVPDHDDDNDDEGKKADADAEKSEEPDPTLRTHAGFATCSLSARAISAGMLRPGTAAAYNLNAQAFDATVSLIRGVMERGVNVREIYVDTVGPPAAHQARLQRLFPAAQVTVAKKADSLFPCVSAASVCAKVTRDAALEVLYAGRVAANAAAAATAAIAASAGNRPPEAAGGSGEKEEEKEEEPGWGSGYPADARCTAWLRRNMHPVFGWGPECRFSWGTAWEMVEASKSDTTVKVDWPEALDGDDDTARLTDYFAAQNGGGGGDGGGLDEELGAWFGAPVGLEAF